MTGSEPIVDTFARVVADLHAAITEGHDDAARALHEALALAPVAFHVDGERFALTESGVIDDAAEPAARIVADRTSVRALLDGELDLAGAARRRAGFDVVGAPATLADAERALRLLVLGAVRLPDAERFYSRALSLCAAAAQEEPSS
jgi:hypothetical protein